MIERPGMRRVRTPTSGLSSAPTGTRMGGFLFGGICVAGQSFARAGKPWRLFVFLVERPAESGQSDGSRGERKENERPQVRPDLGESIVLQQDAANNSEEMGGWQGLA